MIDKYGMIKEMELETYTKDDTKYSLEFNQTPFGDLAMIYTHGTSNNGFDRKSAYKSTYFDDSRNDPDKLDTNIDRAKDWFYEVLGIK